MKKVLLSLLLAVSCFCCNTANANNNDLVLLATRFGGTIAGLPFQPADLVLYDIEAEQAEVFFSQDKLGGITTTNIDAAHLLDSGNLLLSYADAVTIDGQFIDNSITLDPELGSRQIRARDLIEYNFDSNSIVAVHGFAGADLSGATVLPNGNFLFTVNVDNRTLGVDFENGDLIEYDPEARTADLFLSRDVYDPSISGGFVSVDAIDLLDDNRLLLSTTNQVAVNGNLDANGDPVQFGQADVFEIDLLTLEVFDVTDTETGDVIELLNASASLFLDGDPLFTRARDIKAFDVLNTFPGSTQVPEPTGLVLLALGGVVGCTRRFRRA